MFPFFWNSLNVFKINFMAFRLISPYTIWYISLLQFEKNQNLINERNFFPTYLLRRRRPDDLLGLLPCDEEPLWCVAEVLVLHSQILGQQTSLGKSVGVRAEQEVALVFLRVVAVPTYQQRITRCAKIHNEKELAYLTLNIMVYQPKCWHIAAAVYSYCCSQHP